MQRVWLKITEGAGQPELCSGRRFVVVVYKPTRLYIDYYYYLPLAEPGSASASEPEFIPPEFSPDLWARRYRSRPTPCRTAKAKTAPGSGCCCLVVCLTFRPGWRRDLRVAAADEAPGTVAIPAVRAQEVAVSGTYRRVLDVGQHYPAARAANGNSRRGAASGGRPPRSAGVSSPGQSPGSIGGWGLVQPRRSPACRPPAATNRAAPARTLHPASGRTPGAAPAGWSGTGAAPATRRYAGKLPGLSGRCPANCGPRWGAARFQRWNGAAPAPAGPG